MNVTFLVNDATEIQPSQTTAMLIQATLALGHWVGVIGVGDLSCRSSGEPWAQTRWLQPEAQDTESHNSAFSGTYVSNPKDLRVLMDALRTTIPQRSRLDEADLLMLRTNPARDRQRLASHDFALSLAQRCQDNGVKIVNQPKGLMRAATKLYLLELPHFTHPSTLISQDRNEIRRFIASLKASAVLKPLQGTRGNDVFFIASLQDANLNQVIDVLSRQGLVMAQECIPGAEFGDTRVVVFQGKILEINGEPAAIQRVPARGDFRSNIHAGGHAKPGIVTDAMRKVVDAIGPKLMQDGLELVGLDFVGAQLLEVNVFSTGGLRDAEKFTGENFSRFVMESLLQLQHKMNLSEDNCVPHIRI